MVLVLFGALMILALRTAYYTLGDAAAGVTDTFGWRLMEEGTGTATGLMMLPWLVWVTRRFPVRTTPLSKLLAIHAGAYVVYTVAHTLLLIGARFIVVPALGWSDYSPGRVDLRMLSEAPNDAFFYALLVAAVVAFDEWRGRRDRERRYLEMQAQLARAQLSNLQLQLQPHFLFNALNTISSVMYEDVTAADEMIGHLGDLFRRSLSMANHDEVPLREELELLDSYLQLARARFGGRVTMDREIDAAAERCMLPPLLLQPLVENAFKHGIGTNGAGAVLLRIACRNDRLEIVIENDLFESGSARHLQSSGTGLSVTRQRLDLLYGGRADMRAGPVADAKRFRVELRLPLPRASAEFASARTEDARAHR